MSRSIAYFLWGLCLNICVLSSMKCIYMKKWWDEVLMVCHCNAGGALVITDCMFEFFPWISWYANNPHHICREFLAFSAHSNVVANSKQGLSYKNISKHWRTSVLFLPHKPFCYEFSGCSLHKNIKIFTSEYVPLAIFPLYSEEMFLEIRNLNQSMFA